MELFNPKEVERLLTEYKTTGNYLPIIKAKELLRYTSPEKELTPELAVEYKTVMKAVYNKIKDKEHKDIVDPSERWLWEGYQLDY